MSEDNRKFNLGLGAFGAIGISGVLAAVLVAVLGTDSCDLNGDEEPTDGGVVVIEDAGEPVFLDAGVEPTPDTDAGEEPAPSEDAGLELPAE